MTWLMESPLTIVVVSVLVDLALIAALIRSGRGMILGLLGLSVLVSAGLLVAERMVVTDREAIRAAIDRIGDALVTNDLNKVLALLDPNATTLRERARGVLPQFNFKEASVGGDVKVVIQPAANPPTATAEFIGRFRLTAKHGGTLGYDQAVDRIHFGLKKIDGQWLISEAESMDRKF